MHVVEYGDRKNPTILLLHCAGVVPMYSSLYHLSSKYHLVLPHILGTGHETHRDFDFAQTEKEILEIIQGLGKEKVFLLGHSLGANLSFSLVSRHPHLFQRVILSSPAIFENPLIRRALIGYITLAYYTFLRTHLAGKTFAKFLNLPQSERSALVEYWPQVSLKTWRNYFLDGISLGEYPEFGQVQVPILLLYGEKEPGFVKVAVNAMKNLNPGCQLRLVPKGNHGHPVLKSEAFAQTVLEFFT